MPCPVCVNKKLVEITLKNGERELMLRSCSGCETQWWECDGQTIELEEVIGLVKS